MDPAPFEFHAGHNGWVVTGYALAKQVLADRRFSARPELAHGHGAAQLRGFHGPGLFHLSDPPEHTRLRGTVTSEFTPARIQAWESTVRAIADDCIDTLLRDNPDGTADLVAGFAVPFPALVMAEVLGLPPATRDLFLHGARRAVTGGSAENRSHALATFTGFLKENPAGARDLLLYAARKVVTRSNSGDDRAESLALIARFLKETMSDLDEADGFLGRLAARSETDADEAAGIAAQVLVAGTMVPASMLGLALHLLLLAPSRPRTVRILARDRRSCHRGGLPVPEFRVPAADTRGDRGRRDWRRAHTRRPARCGCARHCESRPTRLPGSRCITTRPR